MNPLIERDAAGRAVVRFPPDAGVLFLFRDPERIRRQIAAGERWRMDDVDPAELLDDINTDLMAPAWVCFRHRPADIARDAYAGLLDAAGERLVPTDALRRGGFRAVVSGERKGTGSSREAAAQAEQESGIHLAVAASFAPIHRRNNVNLGQLMGDYAAIARLQAGETLPLEVFTASLDPLSRTILEAGGLFAFLRRYEAGALPPLAEPVVEGGPRTLAEKLLAVHRADGGRDARAGQACLVRVDAGYSHEFTSAQVHHLLQREWGADYAVQDAARFAVFEDHLVYADDVPRMRPHAADIELLRSEQRAFQEHTGVRDFTRQGGDSPGICHQVAREHLIEPGDLVLATDSHTCMGGASNALAWGVGTTEYAGLLRTGVAFVEVPASIRFELTGQLPEVCTAKDLMLQILATFVPRGDTLDRVMEFGGPGVAQLDLDERATLANMAAECSARSALFEADEATLVWIAARRPDREPASLAGRRVAPDPGADYAGGVHHIDLSRVQPMVALPGDPTFGRPLASLPETPIDLAYAGSCTAGKDGDLDLYARVLSEAAEAGQRVAPGVRMIVQVGSRDVAAYAREQGYPAVFEETGVELIPPGCGACIGCGPGVSTHAEQVTVSAINRNYSGRSGPGALYLASPLSVAASAIRGRISAYEPGMFADATR